MRDSIAARVDELPVITPEVLDNFELDLSDIYHGRTSHADIDVVKVATEKTFEFVINLQTAKQIGLTIPPDLLTRATKIIR